MNADPGLPPLPAEAEERLGDPTTWAEPPSDFEARLLAGLRDARDGAPQLNPTPRRKARISGWHLLASAAAVLVVLAGALLVVRTIGDDSPPATQVAMAGTALAPDARGVASIESKPSGFQITLDIQGLAPAPRGSYYQAWLKGANGDLVTIGTFHARGGAKSVVLWSGVDPAHYVALTVTRQEIGGGADSSGQVVLLGSLP